MNADLQKLQVLPNVFKRWIRDDLERETSAYMSDTSPYFIANSSERRDNFEPELFIKSPEDIEKCEQIIKENFRFLQVIYLEGISKSKSYPEIDSHGVTEIIQKIVSTINNAGGGGGGGSGGAKIAMNKA